MHQGSTRESLAQAGVGGGPLRVEATNKNLPMLEAYSQVQVVASSTPLHMSMTVPSSCFGSVETFLVDRTAGAESPRFFPFLAVGNLVRVCGAC